MYDPKLTFLLSSKLLTWHSSPVSLFTPSMQHNQSETPYFPPPKPVFPPISWFLLIGTVTHPGSTTSGILTLLCYLLYVLVSYALCSPPLHGSLYMWQPFSFPSSPPVLRSSALCARAVVTAPCLVNWVQFVIHTEIRLNLLKPGNQTTL